MTYGELENMMKRVNGDAGGRQKKADEMSAREIILVRFEATKDDFALAMRQLRIIEPTITEWELEEVVRFERPDKTGYKPIKVVFKRKSLAEKIAESIELAGDKIPWARRGQTFQQRKQNGRDFKYIEYLNSIRPEGHPTQWVGYFQGGNVRRKEIPDPKARKTPGPKNGPGSSSTPIAGSSRGLGTPEGGNSSHLQTSQAMGQAEADSAMEGLNNATEETSARTSAKTSSKSYIRKAPQQKEPPKKAKKARQSEVRASDLSKDSRERLLRDLNIMKEKEDQEAQKEAGEKEKEKDKEHSHNTRSGARSDM